ncbi:hypothetical protein [Paenibacillus radicis (ex Xue et al. 2023)]|uniref:Post-SET domain-containing protein n=1 Tax=Paenibacillus radicis (ex Xue et al. 2023) TaxID=2972489 RepID=A0ABT1YKR5_9BACL|nr:hypothetical protein [Paenibacillus radicis (ex Xue et al. 2023)]MCR8632848.1 hypothetical protein [Paenibacillus radicis (ex Xue et al. 2023)]
MFKLECKGWSWDQDLQIIHADVRLEVDGEVLIDEPLCVDVGLPALLYSLNHEVEPNRWASPEECFRMPFFCCGCGDPECRAFSFRTRHLDGGQVELTEMEERQHGEAKALATYIIPLETYKSQIIPVAHQYLSFVEGLEYRPYFADTIKVVRQLVNGHS